MSDRLAAIQRALDGFQRDEARTLLKEELAENPSAAAYHLAAQAALTQGDRVDYLQRALEIDPDYQLAVDELAEIAGAGKVKTPPKTEPVSQAAGETREPPATASPQIRLAPIGKRWLAIIIDSFIVTILTVLLLMAGGALAPLEAALVSADEASITAAFSSFQSHTLAVNLLVSGIYNAALMVFFNGQTLGKMMLRLRVIKKRGGRITLLDALLRNVFGYMISQIFLLGYLWALFDREKQAWHDKMAGTVVVEERPTAQA